MNPQEILQALEWRYAVKKFDPARKIPAETWATLEEVLRLTPSSFGLQLWKFIVVKSPEVRAALKPHAWEQDQIVSASHLVVFANKVNPGEAEVQAHINNIAATRNTPIENLDGYRIRITNYLQNDEVGTTLPHWTARQCYIALGFFMSACAMMKIDTCAMEGFERESVDSVLQLSAEGYSTAVMCAAGYRSPDDAYQNAKKVRYPLTSVLTRV